MKLIVFGCAPDEAELFASLAPSHGVTVTLASATLSRTNVSLATGHGCVSVDHRTPVEAPTLRALRRLGVRHLSTRSVGLDHIDVEAATGLGIEVGTASYAPDGVADYTVMHLLMLLRGARPALRDLERHDYRLGARSRDLRDLTVGVVGTGRIGTAVIERLRGFGCGVIAHDPRTAPGVEHVSLDDLLQRSDVVTLHAPLTPDTFHLLDAPRIAAMKPGALVLNTARGALIDTDALVHALEDGHLGGAALDVVEGEKAVFYADHAPIAGSTIARLHALPNVILSPHPAYYTVRALRDTVENTLISCSEHLGRKTACLG